MVDFHEGALPGCCVRRGGRHELLQALRLPQVHKCEPTHSSDRCTYASRACAAETARLVAVHALRLGASQRIKLPGLVCTPPGWVAWTSCAPRSWACGASAWRCSRTARPSSTTPAQRSCPARRALHALLSCIVQRARQARAGLSICMKFALHADWRNTLIRHWDGGSGSAWVFNSMLTHGHWAAGDRPRPRGPAPGSRRRVRRLERACALGARLRRHRACRCQQGAPAWMNGIW